MVWGFAEATVFFIVPDLLLTGALILFGLSAALRMAGAAALAASLGGAILLVLGAQDPELARAIVLSVPLIGDDLLARVQGEMLSGWPGHLMVGAISGAPFKIYAVEAGATGVPALAFILVGLVARFARFCLLIGLFCGVGLILRRFGKAHWDWRFFTIFWGGLYLVYSSIRILA